MKKLIAILSIGYVVLGSGCASVDPSMVSSLVNSAAAAYDSRNKLKAALGEQRTTQDIYMKAYAPSKPAYNPYSMPYRPAK